MPSLRLSDIDATPLCLLKAISGSHAYGLAMAHSDTDVRGIFIAPQSLLYGLHCPPQISDEKSDTVFYELGRFVELALKNNPNVLELLGTPQDCIVQKHPLMARLTLDMFVSMRCRDSFAGYAVAQIKKARGLKKKIVNPMPQQRLGVLDFCHVTHRKGTVPVQTWLDQSGIELAHLGLTGLDHIKDGFAIFHDPTGQIGYRGLVMDEESTNLRCSHVAKEAEPVAWMWFNKDAFARHCKDWQEYQTWVTERNPARYEVTLNHGKGYDAKNLMHTFRLLDIAQQVATTGTFSVRCANREELLTIRRGEREYEQLLAEAEERILAIDHLFAKSGLPATPDESAIEAILVEMRAEYYGQG
jgi:uncharacterized protein